MQDISLPFTNPNITAIHWNVKQTLPNILKVVIFNFTTLEYLIYVESYGISLFVIMIFKMWFLLFTCIELISIWK